MAQPELLSASLRARVSLNTTLNRHHESIGFNDGADGSVRLFVNMNYDNQQPAEWLQESDFIALKTVRRVIGYVELQTLA